MQLKWYRGNDKVPGHIISLIIFLLNNKILQLNIWRNDNKILYTEDL